MSVDQCKKALKEWFRLEKKRLQQAAYNNKKKEATAATKNPDDEVCIYSLHTYYLSFCFNIKCMHIIHLAFRFRLFYFALGGNEG
jgi:hypothetical protein